MGEFEYKESKLSQALDKSEALIARLPGFCRTYARGIEGTVSPLTVYEYLVRLNVFFEFLHEDNTYFSKRPVTDITYEDVACLEAEDIEEFTHYIRTGGAGSAAASNKKRRSESTVNHYLCAMNSLWDYAVSHGRLKHNVIKDVKRGKKPKTEVIALDGGEKSGMLAAAAKGANLTDHQARYRTDASIARDVAICEILMKTGLRVSELVGINLDDVNLKECFFHVNRKESKIDDVFFSDSVKSVLEEWLRVRPLTNPPQEEKALFVATIGSSKGTRLSVRSVQKLVKKYAVAGAPTAGRKVTPHKLRSTFATDMLRATGGDLTLVQEEMNHDNPATTSIYLQSRKNDMRNARNKLDESLLET